MTDVVKSQQVAASLEELASWVAGRAKSVVGQTVDREHFQALLQDVQVALRKRALEIREVLLLPNLRRLPYGATHRDNLVEERHESFGMVYAARSETPAKVFGFSASEVPQTIEIVLSPAVRVVDKFTGRETVGVDCFRRPIARFRLSYAQWADLVGGLGTSVSVPCTLTEVQGLPFEPVPSMESHFQIVANSFLSEVAAYEADTSYQANLDKLEAGIKALGLNKGQEKSLLKQVTVLKRQESAPLEAARWASSQLRTIIGSAVNAAKIELQKFKDMQ